MTREMMTVCAALMMARVAICAAPAPITIDQLRAVNQTVRCEHLAPGKFVFAGDTARLAECLAKQPEGRIDELRISSGGGDAIAALALARTLRDRLDLVIVEKLCASSCANYVLPAATRVRVLPDSYVMLHGSLEPAVADGGRDSILAQFRAMMPDLTEAELQRQVDDAQARLRADIVENLPAQSEFERETLACEDWLAPTRHFRAGQAPEIWGWLLVTPEMARRCLRTTRIVEFWPPTASAFEPQIGVAAARR